MTRRLETALEQPRHLWGYRRAYAIGIHPCAAEMAGGVQELQAIAEDLLVPVYSD